MLHPFLEFEIWSPQAEADQIRSLDVGLMPLESSEWSKGKCAYKMLLYAASGIPSISSNVGMNKELIDKYGIGLAASSPEEWLNHLEYCYQNKSHLRRLYSDSRAVVCDHFSYSVVQKKISSIFQSLNL